MSKQPDKGDSNQIIQGLPIKKGIGEGKRLIHIGTAKKRRRCPHSRSCEAGQDMLMKV